ncbi:MAG: DUF1385 domain-containing protein [Clostridia bacterium]
MSKVTTIGGQALLEGIMMLGPKKAVAAFCDADGEISTKDIEVKFMRDKYPVLGKPFIRGVFNYIDTMKLGMQSMQLAADMIEEEEPESKFDKWLTEKIGDKMTVVITTVGSVLGVALSLFLFMYLPVQAFNGFQFLIGKDIEVFRALFEGLIKVLIFVGYIVGISFVPDIKRVFMYHGAEHKAIFCYEADLELTVENVKKQKRFHPRCGTSFLVILIVLGVIVGMFIPFTNALIRTFFKILTLPVIVSLGYELIKLCGKYDNLFTKIIRAPGLWVQRITTKEPDDKMMETAIIALKAVIPENGEDIVK